MERVLGDGWIISERGAPARKYSSKAALSLRVRLRGTKFAVSLLAKQRI